MSDRLWFVLMAIPFVVSLPLEILARRRRGEVDRSDIAAFFAEIYQDRVAALVGLAVAVYVLAMSAASGGTWYGVIPGVLIAVLAASATHSVRSRRT